jgi:hypothetical protein
VTVPQLPGARVRSRRGGSVWEVRAQRVHDVQSLAVVCVGAPPISRLDLVVESWRAPVAGWLGTPRLAGLTGISAEPKGSGLEIQLTCGAATDPAVLLAAAVRILRPVPRDVGPELTFAPGLPAAAAALAGQLRDVLMADENRDEHVRRTDLLVVPDVDSAAWPERQVTVHVAPGTWTRDGRVVDVCVDPTVHRPVGRRSTGSTAVVPAAPDGAVIRLDLPDGALLLRGDLGPSDVTALRRVGAVTGDVPASLARQLNACGVLTGRSADDAPDPGDHLAWQAASVHERRHALRQFSPPVALDAWPSVSVILVTHRPDHLDHAIGQLRGLRYPRLQVVIGAHGDRVDAARVWDLAQDLPFPTTVVAVDGSRNLGEALQLCSDRAEGALLTKMDDDDFYGPEHIWDLVLARQYAGAEIVGKALDWIHLESEGVTVFRPTYAAEKYADFVAGGTILISRADLDEVGGWRPVPKSVDRALLDRVLAAGGLVYRTHGLGYVYVRHSAGHTAAVRDEHFLTKTTATYPGLISHEAFGTANPGDAGAAT